MCVRMSERVCVCTGLPVDKHTIKGLPICVELGPLVFWTSVQPGYLLEAILQPRL